VALATIASMVTHDHRFGWQQERTLNIRSFEGQHAGHRLDCQPSQAAADGASKA
jgi:hypothetical protein